MPRFYVDNVDAVEKSITITGEDVNHIKNVLRLKVGNHITICNGNGLEYTCKITKFEQDGVVADIEDINKNAAELSCAITLFQGMPKSDKLELVIQKAVELGASEIVPVLTKRTVVKIDEKKKIKKLERYNSIAESASKQSGRGIIPSVPDIMGWKDAIQYAKQFDMLILPYENADGIGYAKSVIEKASCLPSGSKIGIFIGPEGGFAEEEIEDAKQVGMKIITLGNRILRTETAGLTVLSILMFMMEQDN